MTNNGYYTAARDLAHILATDDCRFAIVRWAKSHPRMAEELSAALEEGAQAGTSPPILFKRDDVLAVEAMLEAVA